MTFNAGDKAIFQNTTEAYKVGGDEPDPLNGHEVTVGSQNGLFSALAGFPVYDITFEPILDEDGDEYSESTMPGHFLTLVGAESDDDLTAVAREINIGDKFIFSNTEEVTPFEGKEVTVTELDLIASLMAGQAVYVVDFEPVTFEGHEYHDSHAVESELTPVEAEVLA